MNVGMKTQTSVPLPANATKEFQILPYLNKNVVVAITNDACPIFFSLPVTHQSLEHSVLQKVYNKMYDMVFLRN